MRIIVHLHFRNARVIGRSLCQCQSSANNGLLIDCSHTLAGIKPDWMTTAQFSSVISLFTTLQATMNFTC